MNIEVMKHKNRITMNSLPNLRIRIYQYFSKPNFNPKKVMCSSKFDILNSKIVFQGINVYF